MSRKGIHIEGISKVYGEGNTAVHALKDVTMLVAPGEVVGLIGPSGSGKSTLLKCLGAVIEPTAGRMTLGDEVIYDDGWQVRDLRALRRDKIGFVFQQFNLLARTSALENVKLPLTYAGVSGKERDERAMKALERVGLGKRTHHAPNELSGGQQQRVAIARAIVNEPAILLADEPTGALDSKTGVEIMDLFQSLHRENGQTVILVTHDAYVARHTDRIIRISDGKIVSDEVNPNPIKAGAPRVEG